MGRELLLLVPGLSATKPGVYKEKLFNNLKNYAFLDLSAAVMEDSSRPDSPEVVWTFRPADALVPTRTFELREVIWADLPERLSALKPWQKARKGAALIPYAFSLARVAIGNIYQLASVFLSALILLVWYGGIVIAVIALVGEWAVDTAAEDLVSGIVKRITEFAVTMAPVWALVSALVLFLPVHRIVDGASAMKQYLQKEELSEEVQVRIATALGEATGEITKAAGVQTELSSPATKPYELITVLAYSFGAVPAVESLRRRYKDKPPGLKIRLITLGAPLPLASEARSSVAEAARWLAKGERLTRWHFLWSTKDWLSADPNGIGLSGAKFDARSVDLGSGFWPGSYHERYFSNDNLARILLETVPAN